jgi:hypothetical protein
MKLIGVNLLKPHKESQRVDEIIFLQKLDGFLQILARYAS